MPTVYYGTRDEPGFELEQSNDLIVVRTRSGQSITKSVGPVPSPFSAELKDGTLVVEYPEAGVEVYRVPVGRGSRSLDERKTALRMSPDVRFAGGVLVDPQTKDPVLYTENLFIKFKDTTDPEDCQTILREAGLMIKEQVSYATNAYFVAAPDGTGQKVFEIANNLLKRDDVEYCHPELIRPRVRKSIYPQQWHMMKTTLGGMIIDAHANVEAAHEITQGEGATIAIIDDGIDIDHPEFISSGKIVAPRDATLKTNDPRPKDPSDFREDHGTACAGVASANGINGASGVAPLARLMPIRLSLDLGSQREADAFAWAADNGADVISCSWGPADGRWWDPDDPRHSQVVPLPLNTRLAIDYATKNGRGGKGCVVMFAAGNGNEPINNDGYASYSKVIAVAACNDRGKRSVYSDFGDAVWCAFPSSDFGYTPFNQPDPLTSGIWTTDRSGAMGYNAGDSAVGDAAGNYTNSFGGTSSSCPGAAGVAALVISVNPNLKWNEVKDILRQSCDRIDPQGGNYDSSGHSSKYGYGRLNARTAVELAKPQPVSSVTICRKFNSPIPDLQTVSFSIDVADNTPVETVTFEIDLEHTYIGDLIIKLEPPANTRITPIVLHNRAGGSAKDLKNFYDKDTTPAFGKFTGKSCKGIWVLHIKDTAAQDAGTLVGCSLGLTFAHPDSTPRIRTIRRAKKNIRKSSKKLKTVK